MVHAQASSFTALVCSAIPPTLESCWSVLRRRRLDVMAALVVTSIVLGLGLMVLSSHARLLLVRESLVTGALGAGFLASLLLPRPLIFYVAREMAAGNNAQLLRRWQARWTQRSFRRGMRLMTLVWGAGLLLEAAIRVTMAESMSITHFLAVSPFVQYGISAALIAWTVGYAKRMKRAARTMFLDRASANMET
ncbi:MAG TPA: VC0807 family protein [Gammaproteobacteria bacterium]|nr:VC0807 family protein [Gammaproteobacteria bacterium]